MPRIAAPIAFALLAGCSSMPPPDGAATPTMAEHSERQLAIGEIVQLADGSQLTYLRLVDDSRCQPNVQCIWAGDAEIALRWKSAKGTAYSFSLHTSPLPGKGERNARPGAYRVTLTALERGIAPKATLRIDGD